MCSNLCSTDNGPLRLYLLYYGRSWERPSFNSGLTMADDDDEDDDDDIVNLLEVVSFDPISEIIYSRFGKSTCM